MLNENNNIKIYEFDFGNPFKKFISYFMYCFVNANIVFYLSLGMMGISASLKNNIDNLLLNRILAGIILTIIIAVIVFLFILTCRHKRVILTDYAIDIQRNSLPSLYHLNRGFNDYILYSDIDYCEFNELYAQRKYRGIKDMVLPFVVFNNYSVVKIKDKYGGFYQIPIENAEDFIREVNERVDIAIQKKNSNIKEQ